MAMEKLISDCEQWLQDRGIIDKKTVQVLRRQHGITTDRIVAMVENFGLPAYKLGEVDSYVKSELQKARFFSFKLKNVYKDDTTTQAQLDQAADRLKTFTMEDHAYIVRQLKRICAILLMH